MDAAQYRAALIAHAAANTPDHPLPEYFVDVFCAEIHPDYLSAGRDPAFDADVAHRLWRALVEKPAGETWLEAIRAQSEATQLFVVLPDMPFITDSVLMDLTQQDLAIGFLMNMTLAVPRDAQGSICQRDAAAGTTTETLLYFELDPLTDAQRATLVERVREALGDVAAAVGDYAAMQSRVRTLMEAVAEFPDAQEASRCRDFLDWLLDNHFTFLGYREFSYLNGEVTQVQGSELGVMRRRKPASARIIADMPVASQAFLTERVCLSFSKSGTRSRVHRPAYPDYVGVKRFAADGSVIGECGFYGLYTSPVYTDHPRSIPFLRDKTEAVLERAGLDPHGYDGKNLAQILITYPRDELFQISVEDLYNTALAIALLHERRITRLFVREVRYGLFYTCLVYVPRELYNTKLRMALEKLFTERFAALDIEFNAYFSESILVRLQFSLRVDPTATLDLDTAALEAEVVELARDWHHSLKRSLRAAGEMAELGDLFDALPVDYDDVHSAEQARKDLKTLSSLSAEQPVTVLLESRDGEPLLRFFCRRNPLKLSMIMPTLENFGFAVHGERTFALADGVHTVHEYGVTHTLVDGIAPAAADAARETLVGILTGNVTNDPYNRLIITSAGAMTWREVGVLRAYAAYMKQAGFGFEQHFLVSTLSKHVAVTRQLVDYFLQRLDPVGEETPAPDLNAVLEHVDLLNEDRALRKFFQLVRATVRTNYFQRVNGNPPDNLAFKLQPEGIEGLPRPLPAVEMFVFGPQVEGVHLRSSRVARGGIRWSDRSEDYRTEVLDLMKTQVVKNALIVPSGAKGGFLVKHGERSPAAGLACYRAFIGCLLDLADNIVDGAVVPPQNVRRHDGDDPYLVVAADKGTATFSDEANALALARNFWLADAFASGGSSGYDHKKMGITARGAWVSVVHHLRRVGTDPQVDEITAVGIGDMSGDVFGNGMLSSNKLLLVGAFNHRHIFLDPDPDAGASFVERQRLFEQALGWDGYDTALISDGGGVFERTRKSIPISPQVARRLDVQAEELSPDELIAALLQAPVSLLWNGGVGTYVKAAAQRHADAGDRVNDNLRVNATQLRCRVIGEGGNLGMTQAARVEFARLGGAVNADFIDNSGGVDCSDHEVNLKILLNAEVAAGRLTMAERDKLLRQNENAVAELVLSNNGLQALALTLSEQHARQHPEAYARLIDQLEQAATLDRSLHALPDREAFNERVAGGETLTRPELAVVMCSTKNWLKAQLLQDLRLDEQKLRAVLRGEFPAAIADAYDAALLQHPLAAEIAATLISNQTVDQLGTTFVHGLLESTGAGAARVVMASMAAQRLMDFAVLREGIVNASVSMDLQVEALLALSGAMARFTGWLLRRQRGTGNEPAHTDTYIDTVAALVERGADHYLDAETQTRIAARRAELIDGGFEPLLAQQIAAVDGQIAALCVAEVAISGGADVSAAAQAWQAVGQVFEFPALLEGMGAMPVKDYWEQLERGALLDELLSMRLTLARSHLLPADDGDGMARSQALSEAWRRLVAQYRAGDLHSFAFASLTVRKLAALLNNVSIPSDEG